MVAKKPEHEKEKEGKEKPVHEKERVKKLIEEKMEKIRKQELVKSHKAEEEAPEAEKKAEKTKQPAAKKEPKAKPLPASVFVTGKRKRAIARAYFKPGKGMIKVNSKPIDLVMPDMFRLKMMEPLMVIGDEWKRFDGKITVTGGGPSGQADAVRQVIARGLSELLGPEARKTFLSYDRNLIVYDSRRTEPHKPPRSSQGPRRYKQRSKR
jgi:small subunit ribosomal protein S9